MVKKIYSFALNAEVLDKLDDFRRAQKMIPSRSEAIEYLINQLSVSKQNTAQETK